MRVIAGALKGRRLVSPPERGGDGGLRPTTDRVKTMLFDLLGPLEGTAEVLDLFAGTGSLGIEALSRGAGRAVFVERDPGALRVLRANLAGLGLTERSEVIAGDAFVHLRNGAERVPLVLADPPYGEGHPRRTLEALTGADALEPGGRVAIEHDPRDDPGDRVGGLARAKHRNAGGTALSIYAWEVR